jgi:hypothetical protein
MTRARLAGLPQFNRYFGKSTIQVRVCELGKLGLLVELGKHRAADSTSTIYGLPGQTLERSR